jgi:peptide/nickel transport system permease protein
MAAALGPSIPNVILAISIPIMPRAARVIRASVLSIREFQYIEAARSLGLTHLRIAFRHILPNTIGPFIVLGTAQLGSAILTEAALSFLGLGVPEPYPSWGRMLSVSAAEYAQKARRSSSPALPSAWPSSGRICSGMPFATLWTRACAAPDPTLNGRK